MHTKSHTSYFLFDLSHIYLESLLSSLPLGGVTDGNCSDCEYGSDPHTILESEGRPWSRTGRVKWSNESELELSPGSLRTICFGGILPGDLFKNEVSNRDISQILVIAQPVIASEETYIPACMLVDMSTGGRPDIMRGSM